MTSIDKIGQSIADCDSLIRILHAAPPERFRMADYYAPGSCGTAACVAGWAAWDGEIRSRFGLPSMRSVVEGKADSDPSGDAGYIADELLPAFGAEGWYYDRRRYIYGVSGPARASEVDDAPFAETPAESEAMGADWAFGMAERSAAINRIGIVRAALVKWRDALSPTPSSCARNCGGLGRGGGVGFRLQKFGG